MTFEDFKATLSAEFVPQQLSPALRALWLVAKGRWPQAHRIVQAEDAAACQWVHAHLHRVEGDQANAAYWYRKAGKPVSTLPLDEEWDEIARNLV